jgi:hypothetical protein
LLDVRRVQQDLERPAELGELFDVEAADLAMGDTVILTENKCQQDYCANP